jgi:hypothetical protein
LFLEITFDREIFNFSFHLIRKIAILLVKTFLLRR